MRLPSVQLYELPLRSHYAEWLAKTATNITRWASKRCPLIRSLSRDGNILKKNTLADKCLTMSIYPHCYRATICQTKLGFIRPYVSSTVPARRDNENDKKIQGLLVASSFHTPRQSPWLFATLTILAKVSCLPYWDSELVGLRKKTEARNKQHFWVTFNLYLSPSKFKKTIFQPWI